MQFGLSESQQILKDTASKFFAGECAMPEARKLMETETAYDPVCGESWRTRDLPASLFLKSLAAWGWDWWS